MRLPAALTVLLATAHADERTQTVSVSPQAIGHDGIAVEYERLLPAQRIGLVAGLGARTTATGDDYDSSTVVVSGELRYWLRRHVYLGARLDFAHTEVVDAMDEQVGAHHAIGVAVLAGYRFTPWRGLEVRPFGGLALRSELDHGNRLAAWQRPSLVYGLAVGWSF